MSLVQQRSLLVLCCYLYYKNYLLVPYLQIEFELLNKI